MPVLGHGARVLPLDLVPVPGHGAQISARAPTKGSPSLNGALIICNEAGFDMIASKHSMAEKLSSGP